MADNGGNSNDAGREGRLQFIRKLLKEQVGVQLHDIKPVAYEEDFPFPYNNFVYAVKVTAGSGKGGKDFGSVSIPDQVNECIVRLPNSNSGYNDANRVQNEVAALCLAREALRHEFPNLVPAVYAWGTNYDKSKQGWILQEFKPGMPFLHDFESLQAPDKQTLLKQMAKVLARLQQFELPKTIRGYGGLDFDSSGAIVSAPMSFMHAGPFETYSDLVRATIECKLKKADEDSQVQGWHANGIRARLDEYLQTGLSRDLANLDHVPKVLVHADFTSDNVLYDPDSMQLTALLDFDFAHVATYEDEFFRSLGGRIGQFPSTREDDDEELVPLRHAMLHGFPAQLPMSSEIDWPSAQAWDAALTDAGAKRPSTLPHIDHLSDLFWLSGQLLPFRLCNPVVIGNSTADELQERRRRGERKLMQFLTDHGY